jgi:membrane protein implicated in regulation of membrane protease activity
MVPLSSALQSGGSAELLPILLFATVLSVPVVLIVGVFLKRALRRDREIDELQERVEELESERG